MSARHLGKVVVDDQRAEAQAIDELVDDKVDRV